MNPDPPVKVTPAPPSGEEVQWVPTFPALVQYRPKIHSVTQVAAPAPPPADCVPPPPPGAQPAMKQPPDPPVVPAVHPAFPPEPPGMPMAAPWPPPPPPPAMASTQGSDVVWVMPPEQTCGVPAEVHGKVTVGESRHTASGTPAAARGAPAGPAGHVARAPLALTALLPGDVDELVGCGPLGLCRELEDDGLVLTAARGAALADQPPVGLPAGPAGQGDPHRRPTGPPPASRGWVSR